MRRQGQGHQAIDYVYDDSRDRLASIVVVDLLTGSRNVRDGDGEWLRAANLTALKSGEESCGLKSGDCKR